MPDTTRRCVDSGPICPSCEAGGRCAWDWPTDVRSSLRFDPFRFPPLDENFYAPRPAGPSVGNDPPEA